MSIYDTMYTLSTLFALELESTSQIIRFENITKICRLYNINQGFALIYQNDCPKK